MSNNAVFCVSNNIKTVRLTVYRCKPHTFLIELERMLSSINCFEVDELVMILIENGFELDAEFSSSFTPASMTTGVLVNWAWSLDLESKRLSYWDITAALNGIQDTIEQDSISPLDFSNWISSDAVTDYEAQVNESNSKLNELGIEIVNF